MTPHRRGTSPKLSPAEQDEAVHRVVHSDELSTRDRAAAILVIVFGQQIEHVVRLTWRDVTVTDEPVTIRLGNSEIALASPLDEPWHQLASKPGHDLTAAHPHTDWVFRGYSPGAIVMNRVWILPLVLLAAPAGMSEEAMLTAVAGTSSWLSWVVNLLIAEWWLKHRGRRRQPGT